MQGKLLVIDAPDGCGKATQADLLYQHLKADGYKVMKLSFPIYEDESALFVKHYLNGDYGKNPNDVDAKAASSFYAFNRFHTFKNFWETKYNEGYIIICDRYVTSNMIHQATKISDSLVRQDFLQWVMDLEYNAYKLPKPNMVIYLNVPPEVTFKLCENRVNKIDQSQTKDIHECNKEYLKGSYATAITLARNYNWQVVDCLNPKDTANILPKEEIHNEIYQLVKTMLNA